MHVRNLDDERKNVLSQLDSQPILSRAGPCSQAPKRVWPGQSSKMLSTNQWASHATRVFGINIGWVQALIYQTMMVLVSDPLWINTSSRVLLATVAGPAFSLLLDETWKVTPMQRLEHSLSKLTSKISRNQQPSSTSTPFCFHQGKPLWDTLGHWAQDARGGGWDEAPSAAASFSSHEGHG